MDTGPSAAPFMLSVSGCRGIVGETMTAEVAARFAGVFAGVLRARAWEGGRPLVVLARDGRAGGEVLARGAASGLAGGGCDVLDLGVAATPTAGVVADERAAAGGLVITASHNPQEWNGLKPILRDPALASSPGVADAAAPSPTEAAKLIAAYGGACAHGVRGAAWDAVGNVRQTASGALGVPGEASGVHVDRVKRALAEIGAHDDRRSVSVRAVLDSVNASGREAGAAILGPRLVHHLGAGATGLFPHPPEPLRENLEGLGRFVREKGASVGFAQDPDADRLALVDERGEYVGEEYTLVLAAEAVLAAGGAAAAGGVVCANLSTSRMIDDVAARHGARVVRTPVGEAHVVSAMKRERALIGGEGNGGVIWPRVGYIRDSIAGMGLILALLARTGRPLSELVGDGPRYAIIKRKVGLRSREDAERAVAAVDRACAGHRIDRQDGVRVDFDDRRAWLHVRGSNTEPIIRLIAEAGTPAEAGGLLDAAERWIARA